MNMMNFLSDDMKDKLLFVGLGILGGIFIKKMLDNGSIPFIGKIGSGAKAVADKVLAPKLSTAVQSSNNPVDILKSRDSSGVGEIPSANENYDYGYGYEPSGASDY